MKGSDRHERERRRVWMIPACAVAVALTCLVAVFPYASGYGSVRRSLFASARGLWSYADWQHCMLVPFIVIALLVYKRKDFAGLAVKGSGWGLACVCAALVLYWAGYKTNIYYFGFGAIQILLAGLIIWFLGWVFFRKLFFYWLFLVFTWPLYFLTDSLAFNLRRIMIAISSAFLNLAGVANIRRGTSIESLPDFDAGIPQGAVFQLDIADPCSGIRSLFALMMVSALWGFLTLKKPWQRIALFFSAIPLAVLGNFFRVLLLVYGSILFGTEFAIGAEGGTSTYHFVAGIAVFVVALGGMVLLARLLRSGGRLRTSESLVRTVRAETV